MALVPRATCGSSRPLRLATHAPAVVHSDAERPTATRGRGPVRVVGHSPPPHPWEGARPIKHLRGPGLNVRDDTQIKCAGCRRPSGLLNSTRLQGIYLRPWSFRSPLGLSGRGIGLVTRGRVLRCGVRSQPRQDKRGLPADILIQAPRKA